MARRREPTLADLLPARAAEAPATMAFVVEGAGALTYAEWELRSNAAARGLRDRRVGPGDPVVLWFDASAWIELAVAYAGAHKVGAVPVPLEPSLRAPDVAKVSAHCRAAALVVGGHRPPANGPPGVRCEELEEGQDGGPVEGAPGPADPAELTYRCGFLTRPQPRSRAAAEIVGALAAGDGPDPPRSVIHAFAPGTTAASEALWFPLSGVRGPVVVLPAFDPDRFCALAAEHRAERWHLTPATARWLVESGALDRHDVSPATQVVLEGGRPPVALLGRLAARLPGASVLTVLGPARARTAFAFDPGRPGSVGRSLVPGRLPQVPEAELWRVPLDDRTSSPGYTDEGFVYLVRREREVVRRRGVAIAEADVLGALGRHPAVADAALVAVPPDDGAVEVVAAVALRSPAEPAELETFLRRELGERRAPGSVVVVDRVPRNRSRLVLDAPLRAAVGLAGERRRAVPPQGELEETIASVWERVLDRAGIGADEDFLELGGDELAAAEVVALLDEALDVRLAPSAVLDAPTVSALAEVVERARRTGGTTEPAPVPVAASQVGMVWHEQFTPGSQNLPPLVRRYRGPLDPAVFERALGEIVRRHEPLRTTFELQEGRLVQVVSAPSPLPVPLPVRDLAALPAAEQEEALARALEDAGRPFDLVEGPLFEPTLLRLGPEDHVAVFRVHHSVYDDWSVSVFRRELSALYTSMAAGDPPPLPDPPVPFSTFARRQRRRLAGPAGTRQLRWWKHTLAGGPLGLELPIDDPDRPEGSAQPSAEPVSLDLAPELSAHLRALAARQRVTPFMTVLAAFEVLVHRCTGQADLLLASVVANRNRTELEGMIGCFTKKILLRQTLRTGAAFADVLTGTRSVLLGALSNQDLAFETVVQEALGAPAASHGLVSSPVVMVQGVTPQAADVVLPGIETTGFETSATTRRRHFRGGPDEDPPGGLPWGAGLYRGTFLILSVAEHDDHLSLSARGAFHRPAVERLLANFGTLLADAVAHPFKPVYELALVDPSEPGRAGGDDPPERCLHDLFDEQVTRSPSRLAVASSSAALTFAEVAARVEALARRLAAVGVGPGSLVGVCLPPSIDCVVGVLATWKAGAAYVGLDPHDADGRRDRLLDETAVAAVLAPPDLGRSRLAGRRVVEAGADAPGGDVPPGGPSRAPSPSAPAVAFHGAGASAVPGGVVLTHRSVAGLLAGLRGDVYGARAHLRVGLSAGPAEDGFLRQLVALLDGHTLVLTSPDQPAGADVDVVDCTPEQFAALAPGLEGKTVVVGSREPFGPPVGGASVRHLYGPPQCAFGAGLVTAGPGGRLLLTPLVGVDASVRDDTGHPAPIGVTGELHLARPGDAASWRSGILGRHRPDGTMELVAKASDVLQLRGFTVDRAKLEAVLARCPGVGDVRVTVTGGDSGDERLVAHVVPDGAHAPTLADLQLQVWSELPGYAWPAQLLLDEPAVASSAGAKETTAGSGELPEAAFLAALWAEVLGVETVPTDANYWQRFSFLEVVSRARAAGVPLRDEQITRNRTIATLAADLAAERLAAAAKKAP
ncbi:MAG TPA: condensation domain-containing protein [Acidimicrobiales bacterium]|nr:condensation domain-containing protein [Acidimicrobiales bacterium]